MSEPVVQEPPSSAPETKSSKKKKRKAKTKANGDIAAKATIENATEPTEQETSPPETPTVEKIDFEADEADEAEEKSDGPLTEPTVGEDNVEIPTNGTSSKRPSDSTIGTDARLEALVKDRDALRAEVTELRKSIEELQAKHRADLSSVQEQLQETQGEKEEAEEQYQSLLGKVNTIKSQLGERLKADAEDLSQARSRIEELEEQNAGLQEQYTARSTELETLTADNQAQSKELSSLRNRATLSQQNWMKEREELIEQEAYTREEFENAKHAMHDWEVLAMEERSIRRDLGEKVGDLEEQLSSLREVYERAANERDSQSNTVDGLQKALQEIQTARKQELRELVESSQDEVDTLRKQLQDAEKASSTAESELETVKKELERALPFEKEVKEKNLLIGKLRHEAVILNDHLTKALRFLKRGKPQDNVDRQIVTNHLLHFLALDRSDPKKFQILQLIAALLSWTDEQREQAGLARPGTSGILGSLRMPGSPLVHRTPSTPALTSDYFPESSPASKESLGDLWQSFLEQEAQGNNSTGEKSRAGSMAESPKEPKRYLYS